jgi:hypothetical protein
MILIFVCHAIPEPIGEKHNISRLSPSRIDIPDDPRPRFASHCGGTFPKSKNIDVGPHTKKDSVTL